MSSIEIRQNADVSRDLMLISVNITESIGQTLHALKLVLSKMVEAEP